MPFICSMSPYTVLVAADCNTLDSVMRRDWIIVLMNPSMKRERMNREHMVSTSVTARHCQMRSREERDEAHMARSGRREADPDVKAGLEKWSNIAEPVWQIFPWGG